MYPSWPLLCVCALYCYVPYDVCVCVCVCSSPHCSGYCLYCDFLTRYWISRYLPVLLSLFLLVFFLLLLILPLLLFIFSFSLYLKSLSSSLHPAIQKHNPNLTTQINGKVGSFTLYPPKAKAWQTGAVLRQHLAGRLRPVPASLSGPQPHSATHLLAPSQPPRPSLTLQYMLPCTPSYIAPCSLFL